jgi:hypothetical protein
MKQPNEAAPAEYKDNQSIKSTSQAVILRPMAHTNIKKAN